MKKNLRTLCLGLAAVTSLAGFAQEPQNVTGKLWNADMERGALGWDITFNQHNWSKNEKPQATFPGYHGITGFCLENWRSSGGGGLSDNVISQTLTGLPNGVYVFGAYMSATNDATTENREEIYGVSMFANEQIASVATNRVEGLDTIWAHSAKFNVAANVVDGTLTVGVKCELTNASFLVMDNATLYYFGEGVDLDAALDGMARIDMAASLAIADTCAVLKMNVDTLAYLSEKMEAAKALTKAEEAYTADEELYWGMRMARKSVADYKGLAEVLAVSKEAAAKEWSDEEVTVAALATLNTLITQADAMYGEAKANRIDIEAMKYDLGEATALLEMDSCYILFDAYEDALDTLTVGEEMGEYLEKDVERYKTYIEEIGYILEEVEEGVTAATEAKSQLDEIFTWLQEIIDNPISYAEFPIILKRGTELLPNQTDSNGGNGYIVLEGAHLEDYPAGEGYNGKDNIVTYTSQLYRFKEPLTAVRFIVKETGKNSLGLNDKFPNFTLGLFEMYDEDNNLIPLTVDDITSNACHNTLNSSKDGHGIAGMLDKNPNTYFQSSWIAAVSDYHYFEVTLPEGEYSAFKFKMAAYSTKHSQNFPAELEITYVSPKIEELKAALKSALKKSPYSGTAPGFYVDDVSSFYEVVDEANALLDGKLPTDGELQTVIDKLAEEVAKLETMKVVLPDPTKKYRIVTSRKGFLDYQGLVKGLIIRTHRENQPNELRWDTEDPNDPNQEFMFEIIDNDEGKNYVAIKSPVTGMYLGDLYDTSTGERVSKRFGMSEVRRDTFELKPQGYGQFAIVRGGMIHLQNHNSGKASAGSTTLYNSGANDWSSWWIRELTELPCTVESQSETNFTSDALAFFHGVNFVTLTADKECAFENLAVYDVLGNEIPVLKVIVNGNTAGIELDATTVDALVFSFTNTEGVTSVTVDGFMTKVEDLRTAYDAALAVAPVSGDGIGEVADVTAYEAALETAENLLAFGGSEEAIQNAIAALDSAVAGLEYNYPLADKTYFIVSSFAPFVEYSGVDMAIYTVGSGLNWTYVKIQNPGYQWRFIDCGQPIGGKPAYYIQNVESEEYVGPWVSNSAQLATVADTAETEPYTIDLHADAQVTLRDSRLVGGNLHFNGHNSGKGTFGTVISWNSGVGSASILRIIESEKYIADFKATLDIEDVEIADKDALPAKKGIYDLFGRRVDNPAATGIYVVDGKKCLIKK